MAPQQDNTQEDDFDAAEEAAMAAGFASVTATAPDDDPAPSTSAAATPAPAEPAARADAPQDDGTGGSKQGQPALPADPFASLDPRVQQILTAFPSLEQQNRALSDQLRRAFGEIGGLKSQLSALHAGGSRPQGQEATDGQPRRSRFAKVEALRDELPEVAEALDEIAAANAPQRGHEPTDAPAPQPAAAPAVSREAQMLDSLRPTWAEDVKTPDFKAWLAIQDDATRDRLYQTDDPAELYKALGQFDQWKAVARPSSAPPPAAAPVASPASMNTRRQTVDQQRSSRMAAGVVPQGTRPAARGAQSYDEEADMEAGFRAVRARR